MVGTCEACREHISVTVKRIKCTQCNCMFHSECVRFTGDSTSSRTQWKCPNCVAIARKGGDNSNTPIRADKSSKVARSTRTDSADPTISVCDDTRATTAANSMLIGRFESILDAKLKTIKDEIVIEIIKELKSTVFTELKNEIVSLSSELSQLQVAQNHLQSENDQLKSDLCTLQARVTFSEDQLSDLRSQFGRQQQQGRINNLDIVGLPQMTSESPTDLVLKIAEYAGVELKPDDIEFAHRIQPQKPTAGRPKPIVVKMSDRICKDKLLSGLKRKMGICTKDIGFSGLEKKFFVNEHLTPENKQLLKKTKKFRTKRSIQVLYGYDILRHDRNPETSKKTLGGGVLLCASKNLQILHQHDWVCPGVESVWATIPAETLHIQGRRNVHIGLIYAPPDNLLPARINSISTRLAEIISLYPNDYILLTGDFNLPNITWSESWPAIQRRGSVELQNAFLNFYDLCNLAGLKQQNTIFNCKPNTLDLLFSNIDFEVHHSSLPLVSEDKYHPCLEFDLSYLLIRNTQRKPTKGPNFLKECDYSKTIKDLAY
ncbi:unnamed protein product [Leptidea sinapis]|uniref:RING-type domain-containing protein n=1 Tax=Leptidea sinapis TaxID=189913 RepID=A0A5E4QSC4_9NEOP|nr:unnamed protein product [Leptidea sinapis]